MNQTTKTPNVRANIARFAAISTETRGKTRPQSHVFTSSGKGNQAARRIAATCYHTTPHKITCAWLCQASPKQRKAAERIFFQVRKFFKP